MIVGSNEEEPMASEDNDAHPNPGAVGHEHQVAVHAGYDQETELELARRATAEGLIGDGGDKDPEGYPVHAGHAHVAGIDGPQDGESGVDDDTGHNQD
jgi:hypothetical protein